MNLLQQTPLFQELTRDIVLQTEQRVRLDFVLRQLEHKFGPLPEDLTTTLQEITDLSTLDRLGLALLDAADLETFKEQLSPRNMLRHTPLFQELTQDIVLEAMQRDKVQTLLRQLERKFGPLPEDITTALQASTDLGTLDRLGLALLDAPDLDAFRQQLPPA